MNYQTSRHTLLALLAISFASVVSCGPSEGPDGEGTDDPECNGGKCDVIGEDDREDEFSGEVTDRLREIARSTAMLIDNKSLVADGDTVAITADTLGEAYMMCPDARFQEQIAPGFCSAWLVAPDVMVTNGHCLTSQQACDGSSFVFDYAFAEEGQDLSTVPAQNVVACSRVLAWDYTSDCDVDYAVVQLERPVDRQPLEVRGSADELDGDALVIIGHPFGLPRKYSLNGDLLTAGDNNFTTTHDVFGGNSGSGIFDANTGEVQGLVTCGGSNLEWEYYDQGWTLDRKTGQACDTTCDDAGEYADGSWEPCQDGTRRRCVCDEDGTQLVWEKRECLSFEDQSEGQCSREATIDLFTCETSSWRCPTPTMQHTRHFAQFTDAWSVFENDQLLEIEPTGELTSSITILDDGQAQAFSVYLDILGDADPETFDFDSALADLSITLQRGEESFTLLDSGVANLGTAFPLANVASGTREFQVPFTIHDMAAQEIAGEWTLRIENLYSQPYTLHGWRIQAVVKPADEITELGEFPCTSDCVLGWEEGPEPLEENFEGEAFELDDPLVSGTVAEGWGVEIWDDTGEGYEAFKTRRSQTISLQRGEVALVKEFDEDIGGRALTVDYRYDGDGWFQIWADDQIIHSRQEFAQGTPTVSMPFTARTIKFVIGATDGSRTHEATIYSLRLDASTAQPASCSGIWNCATACSTESCIQDCAAAGTPEARELFYQLADCSQRCEDPGLTEEEYSYCLSRECPEVVNACISS